MSETTEPTVACEICGAPMPSGETMFKYHGYSGPCPRPPLPKQEGPTGELVRRAREMLTAVKFAGESQFGPPDDRFPGYEAKVPSEFVTNLEAAIERAERE